MNTWKRFLSYFISIPEAKIPSEYSGVLEMTWENGRLVLNSSSANYSYNHLHKVLHAAMLQAKLPERNVKRVLNLGLGAGSSIHLLKELCETPHFIRSVELDPVIIQIAQEHFNIELSPTHEIICMDAFQYVKKDRETYELILVDLFIDDQVDEGVMSMVFVKTLLDKIPNKGCLIMNSMKNERSEAFKAELAQHQITYERCLSKDNEVFIFLKD